MFYINIVYERYYVNYDNYKKILFLNDNELCKTLYKVSFKEQILFNFLFGYRIFPLNKYLHIMCAMSKSDG